MAIPRDVLSLVMGMFSGHKDDYGKEIVPPLPLSFDRINEGKPSSSAARIFQLPSEILGLILRHVPSDALPNLALVNRDCRQLARSRQFASVHLDYSQNALCLISQLAQEHLDQERAAATGQPRFPSIGACIRRITVATHPEWVSYRHGIGLDDEFMELHESERRKRMEDAANIFFDNYIPSLQDVLADQRILPHLELLDWEDKLVLPRSFFNSIAKSTVQHLKLFRVGIEEAFVVGETKPQQWPLRTLHLEVNPSLDKIGKIDISLTCASILRLCASTLESLTWISSWNKGEFSFGDELSDPMPQFARLQTLRLDTGHHMDSRMWNVLVTDGLRLLKADTEADSSSVEFFQRRGTIPTLITFVWRTVEIPADHPPDFLRANPQLEGVSLESQAPPRLLETQLLPLLCQSFVHLKSLSLRWDGTSIPTSALRDISSLKGLQQLHLSAGEPYGWKHDWLIDHVSMRHCVGQLPCLRKLAFSRDTYPVKPLGDRGYELHNYSRYYSFKLNDFKYQDTTDVAERRWEQIHRGLILSEAHEYMRLLPELDWLYFGQLPMRVVYSTRKRRKVVETLSERDDCWTFLQEMYNGGA